MSYIRPLITIAVAALFASAGSLESSTDGKASPNALDEPLSCRHSRDVVSWSVRDVSIRLLSGTLRIDPISFSSNQDLSDVDVRVAPELQPFLSVTPSHFDSIRKDTKVEITLVFSVSAGSALGDDFDGTVQLRRHSVPGVIARPLPVTLTVPHRFRNRILVDSSRDGGVWWFPQGGPFDSNQAHQGKPLADFLRSLGMDVRELPRPFTITSDLLDEADLVIRPFAYEGYSDSEVEAYHRYVENGGRLILLTGMQFPGKLDALAKSFGIVLKGSAVGDDLVTQYAEHPITEGLSTLFYLSGSGVFTVPRGARNLGRLDQGTFIDLNGNFVQDPGEPSAAPVMGISSVGCGTVFYMGSILTMETVPRPLVDNLTNFFMIRPSEDDESSPKTQ